METFQIASFFSTISRCIRMVKNIESKHNVDGGTKTYYSHLVVTRLDVVSYAFIHYKYSGVKDKGAVVALHEHDERVDDRIFLGPTSTMLLLEPLFEETRAMFLPYLKRPHTKPVMSKTSMNNKNVINVDEEDEAALSPEVLLYQFMINKFPPDTRLLHLKDYVSILHFTPWEAKYNPNFGEKLAANLNTTLVTKKCNEISNAVARSTCFATAKKKNVLRVH
jgi:hypothetical protein